MQTIVIECLLCSRQDMIGPCPQGAHSIVKETDLNQIITQTNIKLQL